MGFFKIFSLQNQEVGKAATQIEQLQYKINATYGPAFATQHAAALRQMTLLNRQLNDKLGPGGVQLATQRANLGNQWDDFRHSFNPEIYKLLGVFFDMMSKLMPIVRPLLEATAQAFIKVAKGIDQMIQGAGFKDFMGWMTGQAGSGIMAFARIVENLAIGFWDLFRAFTPMANGMRTGLVGMTQAFADWARNLGSNQGFQRFMAYIRTAGPEVLHTLGQFVQTFIALGPLLGAAGQSSMILINALAGVFQWLSQWPVVNHLVGALIPFSIIAAKLLGPLGMLATGVKAFWVALMAGEVPFLLTPMGLLLTGLVIAAVVVYTHWDRLKRGLKVWWDWIKTAASDTANWVTRAWDNMIRFIESIPGRIAKAAKNMITMIPGGATFLHLAGSVVHTVGGFLGIPGLASGGTVIGAGRALVGERGPELLDLPQGAQVTPLPAGSLSGQPQPWIINLDGRELMRGMARQQLMASAAGAI